ncbi:MAG: hypothetical protein KC635_11300 [Myxococcales bacterium]|nr:hypothetical protein [Myxococcales bacterium]
MFSLLVACALAAPAHALSAERLTPDALGQGASIAARPVDGGLELAITAGSGAPASVTLTLLAPRGSSGAARWLALTPGATARVVLPRPGGKTADRDLRLLVDPGVAGAGKRWVGVVATFLRTPRLLLLGDATVLAGATWSPRVAVRVTSTNCAAAPCEEALAGVAVTARLVKAEGKGATVLAAAEGTTDAGGTASLAMRVPGDAAGTLRLEVTARSDSGDAEASYEVEATREVQLLLSLDKPLYQPGQTAHVRLLARRRGEGRAAGGEAVTISVFDARDNRVYQRRGKTSPEGVFAAEMAIASLVNTGRWRVEAKLGDTATERTIEVKPYVLPKFKVEVTTERATYKPGEVVRGVVSGRYFFGEALRGATVELSAATVDVAPRELARMQLKLDDAGAKAFELALPAALVASPRLAGAAPVTLTARVTDTAGQTQEGRRALTVAAESLRLVAVPEAGRLVEGVENAVYFLVTTVDGAPVEGAKVAFSAPALRSAPTEVVTDANGIATWRTTPSGALGFEAVVTARDGARLTQRVTLGTDGAATSVLLRPSDPSPRAGQRVSFEVLATASVPQVFVDLVKDGQTIVTLTAPMQGGRGSVATTLPEWAAGTVLATAYVIGADMNVYGDTRPMIVRLADDLHVAVTPGKGAFRPGEEATIDLEVTDGAGHPVLAALGLWVVDEAVFALSELRPGMEEVFFLLEQEIMRPKVEIHAFEPDAAFFPPDDAPKNEAAALPARVLAGAASTLYLHTRWADSRAVEVAASQEVWQGALARQAGRWQRGVTAWVRQSWREPSGRELKRILAANGLVNGVTRDAFGQPLRVDANLEDTAVTYGAVRSAGLDGAFDTADDLVADLGLEAALAPVWRTRERRWARHARPRQFDFQDMPLDAFEDGGGGGGWGGEVAVGGAVRREAPMAPPREPAARVPVSQATTAPATAKKPQGAEPPARVRSYFPETLYVNPLVVTDASGRARVTIPMADSITTWRMSALASAADGRLGSASAGLKVFQEFFVDVSFPASLTRGDHVTVPVAVYNYLAGAQTVRLELAAEGGLELEGPAAVEVTLAANEVKGVQVPLVARRVGVGRLTVRAQGAKGVADAVRREVRVAPDGAPVTTSGSGMLSEPASLAVDVPADAVPGASTLLVKLYPEMFAQVVDGLENILQMPSGCFEQTSSTTYPNILVLRYLRDAKRAKPELEAKALTYLQAGWQRLVTFEVKGGGFSWFGEAPANLVLTSYGLMEFHDMARVYAIDEGVLARTRRWVAGRQQPDGSFAPDAAFLHQESWGDLQKSTLLVSAYVTWALAATRPERGRLDAAVERGLAYLAARWEQETDPYALAYVANALAEAVTDRSDAKNRAVLRRVTDALAKLAARVDGGLMFPTKQRTATYGSGKSAQIEVTALALRAFMRAGEHLELVRPGLEWLVGQKDAGGNWESTQATIQVLQAMVASLSSQPKPTAGTVDVVVNGQTVETVAFTAEDFAVVRFVDASRALRVGKNEVALVPSGGVSAMYAATAVSYVPWGEQGPAAAGSPEAFEVSVAYDRQQLAKDDTVGVEVSVKSNLPGVAEMGIVDVGVPPGFDVLAEDLEAAVGRGELQRFTLTGRQVILYVPRFAPGAPWRLRFRVRARFPVKVSTGPTVAYEYYNPDNRGTSPPGQVTVR